MIIIANKKAGVGCTTLANSLSRIFNLNLYVNQDSFLLQDKYFKNEENIDYSYIKKRTDTVDEKGVYDLGTKFDNKSAHKFIDEADVVVVPVELGYESIQKAIETIKFIRGINYDIPVVVVLNRLLVKDLNDRDRLYKTELEDYFFKADLEFYDKTIDYTDEDNDKLILTYLRNSYGIFTNSDKRKYFLDNFKFELQTQKSKDRNTGNIAYKEKTSDRKNLLDCNDFEFRFFKYLVNKELEKGDWGNDKLYHQDKDMVLFRTEYLNRYQMDLELLDCPYDSDFLRYEKHLIKDMAFVAYAVQCHIGRFY